ncbi:hypothetical protein L489_0049 [Bordetella bronchiseptica 00-P-2730]|nr:hypothetical protein L489_0049 [Bordetella bronchiseptica 00-P-2730]
MMQYGHALAIGHGASARGRLAAAGRWLALMLALVLTVFARPAAALTEDDFLPPEQAFVFSAAMADPATLGPELPDRARVLHVPRAFRPGGQPGAGGDAGRGGLSTGHGEV